jgi:hypothetical protein
MIKGQNSNIDKGESSFYISIDDSKVGIGAIVIQSVAICLFAMQSLFACYNMVKFYRHRSYSLGLFYILTLVNLTIRALFFGSNFLTQTSYWNVVFLCSPASLSCSIGLCQIMNYCVLYIRLDSYAKHRAIKGNEVQEEELEKTTRKEIIVTVLVTITIFAYPLSFMSALFFNRKEYKGNVIEEWERYELIYMINFIVLALLLVLSTKITLSHMRRVFGDQSMREERPIKIMLILFCSTYTVRVIFAIALYF